MDAGIEGYRRKRVAEFNAQAQRLDAAVDSKRKELQKVKAANEGEKEYHRELEKITSEKLKEPIRIVEQLKEEASQLAGEIETLRKRVGPRGTVTDLVRQLEEAKQQIKDKDRELAEKALWLSRDFNAMVEAERIVKEERENTLALTEHVIKQAGALPLLFLVLANRQIIPEERVKDLSSLVDELLVWRSYEKPPGVYKDIIPKARELLKLVKADIEKCLEAS